jgi:hypothetical protein
MSGHVATPAIRSLLRRPNLTAKREWHLLRARRASRDEEAGRKILSELWESHTTLVVSLARLYRRPDLEMTDAVSAGHLGMHAAIADFDPDRFDSRRSRKRSSRIRHSIQDYSRRHAFAVRPPSSTPRRQLIWRTGRLFVDARQSCHREGVGQRRRTLRQGRCTDRPARRRRCSASASLAGMRCASMYPMRTASEKCSSRVAWATQKKLCTRRASRQGSA